MKRLFLLALILSVIAGILQAQVVSLSGKVIGSDTNQPVAGALVFLNGISESYTDEQGMFSFSDVYVNQTYTLLVRAYRYVEFVDDNIVVEGTDLNLGNVLIYEMTYPPRRVYAEVLDNLALVTWEQSPIPDPNSPWFTHTIDNIAYGFMGCMHDTIQTEEPAQRFTPAQLHRLSVSGATLTKVSFFASKEPYGSYTIKIYTGGSGNPLNPGNLVHSQPVPHAGISWNDWNEVILDTPVPIPTSEELWIVISIYHGGGAFAAVDAGPAFAGYGDVYRTCSGYWTTISSMGYSHNTMIRGIAETNDGQVSLNQLSFFDYQSEEPVTLETNSATCNEFSFQRNSNYTNSATTSRALESYDIYRTLAEYTHNESQWTLVARNVPTTEYIDLSLVEAPYGDYRYIIKTVFTNNNISEPAFSNMVKHLPEGDVYIGNTEGTTWSYSIPFNFHSARSSLAQTIYLAEDIKLKGLIYEIEYQFRTPGDIHEETQVEIFMANVGLDIDGFSFSGEDWIPFEMFTQVYSGLLPVNLPSGIHDISIALDVPFDYTGENLVVYTWRKYTSDRWDIMNLFLSSYWTNKIRSINVNNNNNELDPANPPKGRFEIDNPNIKLRFSSQGQGRLQGTVYSIDSPVERVEITINDTNRRTFTNTSGEYSFSNIPSGSISITASKAGYDGTTIENIDITAGETTFQDVLIALRTNEFEKEIMPLVTKLNANFPNPFNPETHISFSVGNAFMRSDTNSPHIHGGGKGGETHIRIDIFNIRGQRITTLVNSLLPSGNHVVVWNGNDENGYSVSSGIYFYRLQTKDFEQTRRMLLLK